MRQTFFLWLVICFLLQLLEGLAATSQTQNILSAGRGPLLARNENCTPPAAESPLVGTKWILVELRGRAVIKSAKSKEFPFLLLGNDFKASAYAGCNRLYAGYELFNGSRIRFTRFASTRMACIDMKTELVLLEVLKVADTY
ncbi:MAG: META domain-containing protein, partial [Bacteroidota bacterium]